ncbi:hypothetical protein [uncultured Shimia sp.]|uniref:hypothetical protein n=1 Tax=uncultured Shimia sp. TaxID=573152 RepID=UPI00260B808E|nr:hypothetical protein [uncultured Shimia sp.]
MSKSLVCPKCKTGTYNIVDSVELGRNPPHWDEKAIQRGRCETCQTRFFSIYEELRSFRMDRDDKTSHVAAPARTWVWALAGLAFLPPARQKSPNWRCKAARAALRYGIPEGIYQSIQYKQH